MPALNIMKQTCYCPASNKILLVKQWLTVKATIGHYQERRPHVLLKRSIDIAAVSGAQLINTAGHDCQKLPAKLCHCLHVSVIRTHHVPKTFQVQQFLTATLQCQIVTDIQLEKVLELLQLLGLCHNGDNTGVAVNGAMVESVEHLRAPTATADTCIGG